jgi:hypothetical protein
MAWALSAVTRAYLGDVDEAERRNNRYKRLSPLDPHAFLFDGFFILIHLLKRDHESAVAMGRAVSEMNPTFSDNFKPYLAALGHLGRTQEAAVVRRRLLTLEPGFTVERFLAATPLERESDRKHYAEGLRLAGVVQREAVVTSTAMGKQNTPPTGSVKNLAASFDALDMAGSGPHHADTVSPPFVETAAGWSRYVAETSQSEGCAGHEPGPDNGGGVHAAAIVMPVRNSRDRESTYR